MFNVINVSYPDDVRRRKGLSNDNLTILDSKACIKLIPDLKSEDIRKSYRNNTCVFIGMLLPSIVKRYRPYDYFAEMYNTATRKKERILITDKVKDYPGYSLMLMYYNEDPTKLCDDFDDELILDEKHVVGGILCDDILQPFYVENSKENAMLVARIRKMFRIDPGTFITLLAANSSSVHMTTDSDINDIISKVQEGNK